MLLPFMLSIFQTMFAHVLFFKVANAFIFYDSVQTKKRKRRTTVTGEANEIAVLAAVHQNPQVSTRQLHRDSGISREYSQNIASS